MSVAATCIRLVAFATLTAGLLRAALELVPGTDLNTLSRSLVFVFVVPWLAAFLVAHPARILRALAVALTGRGDEELTTARTLDLVAGLTVAVGVIGLFGSFLTFLETVSLVDGFDRIERAVPGVVSALAVPPAFALLARFVFYEPVIVALRRRHTPEGEPVEGRPRIHLAWKVLSIALLTVAAVEGYRALFLQPPEKAPPDNSFVAVGRNPETGAQSPALRPDAPSIGKPIRVEILGHGSDVTCRVDGTTLRALPGATDELRERLQALATDGTSRRVEIEAEPKVAFRHLVAAVDAAVRATTPRRPYYATAEEDDEEEEGGEERARAVPKPLPLHRRVRVLVPTAHELAVPLELRFIHERYEHDRFVMLNLPWVVGVETITVDAEDAPPSINVTWDSETGAAEIYTRRRAMDRDDLRAWIRLAADRRRDPVTGVSEVELLLRCDGSTHVGAIYPILTLLAGEPCKVRRVLIPGRPSWEWER